MLAVRESGGRTTIQSVLGAVEKCHLDCDKCERGVAALIVAIESREYSTACQLLSKGAGGIDYVKALSRKHLKQTEKRYKEIKTDRKACVKLYQTLGR